MRAKASIWMVLFTGKQSYDTSKIAPLPGHVWWPPLERPLSVVLGRHCTVLPDANPPPGPCAAQNLEFDLD